MTDENDVKQKLAQDLYTWLNPEEAGQPDTDMPIDEDRIKQKFLNTFESIELPK